MAASSGTATTTVALKSSPDFNRPVTLQMGAEAPAASPHKSVMEMVMTSECAEMSDVFYHMFIS
jgi:hypothetical protein